jgi:protein disulfide-isomerase
MTRSAHIAAVACMVAAMVGCSHSPQVVADPDSAPTTEVSGAAWTESYDGALARARADKKLVLADFTGSDWCHYCIQLRREVLNKPQFAQWADGHLVLLEVDFPRKKQAEEVRAQNERLREAFKVDGYPTVIVLNGDGNEVGRIVGYDGAKEWSDQLQKVVNGAK